MVALSDLNVSISLISLGRVSVKPYDAGKQYSRISINAVISIKDTVFRMFIVTSMR